MQVDILGSFKVTCWHSEHEHIYLLQSCCFISVIESFNKMVQSGGTIVLQCIMALIQNVRAARY